MLETNALQPQSMKAWEVIRMRNDRNSFKLKNERGEIKNVHRTKVQKFYQDIPELYWVHLDDISDDNDDIMSEIEFQEWLIRKSTKFNHTN